MKRIALFWALAVLHIATAAVADIPLTLDYQGVLTDVGASAVPDGEFSIIFRIYDVASGGSALWEETQSVYVYKGIFNVILGSVATLDLPFDRRYYLGVSIEGEAELSPRIALASAPYSITSRGVEGASNTFPSDGNVGIGTLTPDQKLTINGGLRISNTATASGGSIRFTGSDFEGYDGGTWKSLTSAGSGGLPSGAAGQTLRHDGNDWIANDFLYNDGLHIAIGTTSPTELVHILGPGDERLKLESTDPSGSAAIRIKTNGGTFDYLNLQKSGPGAAGTLAGVPVAGLSRVSAGADAGALILHVSSDDPMHFATHNTEWMRIEGNGDLFQYGSLHQKLLHSRGTTPYGADIRLYDNSENEIMELITDPDGSGGQFIVARDTGATGFAVDGNYTGSNEPMVAIYGSARSAIFNMDNSGSSSVSLPASAISDVEMLDEPGAASYAQGVAAVEIGTSYTIAGMRSIVTPTAGYVLVMANCGAELLHTSGTTSRVDFGVSDLPSGLPDNQELSILFDGVLPTGIRHLPAGCHGLFEVTSAGTHTFYLIGIKTSGSFYFYDIQLTLVFIPTAYGDINPTVAGGGARRTERGSAARGTDRILAAPMTVSDIQRERADAETLNAARVERELDELRAEIAKLKQALGPVGDK